MTLGRRVHPRTSLLPALAALLVGLLLHAIDQSTAFRVGPVPILVTAPVVATLCYLRVREASWKRILGLLGWGVASSGLGVLGVYVVAVSYRLPRALTGPEMALYDLGLFSGSWSHSRPRTPSPEASRGGRPPRRCWERRSRRRRSPSRSSSWWNSVRSREVAGRGEIRDGRGGTATRR